MRSAVGIPGLQAGEDVNQHLRLVRPEPPEESGVPDFEALALEQADAAVALTQVDAEQCLQMPWPSLARVVGPLKPWEVWVAVAVTNSGKSTWIMSLAQHWIAARRRAWILPLESPPEVMRLHLAALRTRLPVRHVLPGRWGELPTDARRRIEEDLWWQGHEGAEWVGYSPAPVLTVDGLTEAMIEAQEFRADVLVIDGLNHFAPSDNCWADLTRIMQHAKELTKTFGIPILATAQLNTRAEGDRLSPYRPPKPTSIQGGEVIRQVADVVLGLYRPLVPGLTRADEALLRTGQAKIREYLVPRCLAVSVLKHRTDGEVVTEIVRLGYADGLITEPDSLQAMTWASEAASS